MNANETAAKIMRESSGNSDLARRLAHVRATQTAEFFDAVCVACLAIADAKSARMPDGGKMRVTEYDTARDGGFVAEISGVPGSSALWVAHHQANGRWLVTNYQDENAYLFLSADTVGEMIELAAEKERTQ